LTDDCGTMRGYRTGCRCARCKRANADNVKEYRERQRSALTTVAHNLLGYREGDTSWVSKAACRDKDTSMFFPGRGDSQSMNRARKICAECPVTDDCLAYALRTDQEFGVWGGKSIREREAMRAVWRRSSYV
jgi:WhiB family redox-sensing transcriptional regulator